MKSKAKLQITRLGKISLSLIVLTFAAWLFVNNAENCLSRDFDEQAPPALCWRAANDYESTITQGQAVFLVLFVAAIICTSVFICGLTMKRFHITAENCKKTALFLATFSAIILIVIVEVFENWQRTPYNNNNYALNTTAQTVTIFGLPIWLAITTAAVTYGLKFWRKNHLIKHTT